MTRPTVLFAMSERVYERVFDDALLAEFTQVGDVLGRVDELTSPEALDVLGRADVMVTGWGSPLLDARALDAAPRLSAVLHAAGTVKDHLTEEVWKRGIVVSSAADANAVPVAQFTLAMVLLAGKYALPIAAQYRRAQADSNVEADYPRLGNVGKRVGIVGASRIGRQVIKLLAPHNFEIIVHDPFLTEAKAAELGVRAVDLDELVSTSDIISIHAPSLPETRHMIDARAIAALRPGATIINTARGEIIDQDALTERVLEGDIYAILDVTVPWILPQGHALYSHENVFLTPHIAGSLGTELHLLADSALDELRLIAAGESPVHVVRSEELSITA